ncbi:hypothetical protein PMAYCL1PPCAC_26169, partial [Pristionchus mayeri]
FIFIAIERLVATFAWSWYEKESPLTLLVYFILEGTAVIWSWAWSIAIILEMIQLKQYALYIIYTSEYIIKIVSFGIAYNYRIMGQMRIGARINQYSVARSFQIRENIAIITSLTVNSVILADRIGSILYRVKSIPKPSSMIDTMEFILLDANRTMTDEVYPFFEIIHFVELRLIFCNLVMQGIIGATGRLIILFSHCTAEGPLAERPSVIVATVLRSVMLEAVVGSFFFFAIERLVATLEWSW